MPDNGICEIADLLKDSQNALAAANGTDVLGVLPIRDYHLADYTCEIVMEQIKAFEASLDEDHEIAVKLTSFGQSVTMSVTNIGYADPSTLFFHGLVGEQPATLIQHVSQLNFLILAVRKQDPQKPARRIGFSPPTGD